MIRPLLELLIQRSLDDGTQPPGWLAALIRRDRKLRQFVDESQTLDDALLLSAAARRDALAENCEKQATALQLNDVFQTDCPEALPRVGRHSRLAWVSCSAVAASLLVALFVMNSDQPQSGAPRAQALSQHLTAVPNEMLELLTLAANTSQDRLSRYSPTSVLSYPQFSAWQAKANRIAEPLGRNVQLVNAWLSEFSELGQRFQTQLQEGHPLDRFFRGKNG